MTFFDYGHKINSDTKTSDVSPGTAVAAFAHPNADGAAVAYTAFIVADGKNRKINAVTEGPVQRTVVRMHIKPGSTMYAVLSEVITKLNSSVNS